MLLRFEGEGTFVGSCCPAVHEACLKSCPEGKSSRSGKPVSIFHVNRDAMEVESSTYTDFISCDRAGRRNAVHDIQREATTISMRKLTEDMGDLAVEGAGELPHL
ncbi:hypothetical protein DV515_00010387 [Chloebia gouldiae]|uniref:cAMP-dependent protein kinase inhibitor gamma n=45 Tax=Passeriformes TaxID=9126 RepID=A0A3L8SAX8_CHLGU|nr:hypothetical protein DV515_00010387 [Chloebia gouldiae]